jgi:hypothetical protein
MFHGADALHVVPSMRGFGDAMMAVVARAVAAPARGR